MVNKTSPKQFDETWDSLLTFLREREDQLQVPAGSIREGLLGKLPDWTAPYLAVYLVPADSTRTASGASAWNQAQVVVLCCASATQTQAEALRAAVKIASRVYMAMSQFPLLQMDRRNLQQAQFTGTKAMVTINGTIPFTLLPTPAP